MNRRSSRALQKALSGQFDLKPKYTTGNQRYYRLWMTLEAFDPYGDLQARSQWRGDFQRVVESVDASGRAEERITWKNIGIRTWLTVEARYGAHEVLPWAEGFSYRFSAEDNYDELDWDYSSLPGEFTGRIFRTAFQVSAHMEFDFLRSSRHAAIEKLRRVGEVLRNPPEEGEVFSLDFPPLFTNSRIERKHVQVGLLGLTLAKGEPCALLDYQQGPQDFSWTELAGPPEGESSHETVKVNLKSWQQGVFTVRVVDGSLAHGEFTEWHMIKRAPAAGGAAMANYSRGIWGVREIAAKDYAVGLESWGDEQIPFPQFRPEASQTSG
jgi:hypothetical protein